MCHHLAGIGSSDFAMHRSEAFGSCSGATFKTHHRRYSAVQHSRDRISLLWDCKKENRAFSGLRFDPNSSTMMLHNFLAARQSDARSRPFRACFKSLKNPKDTVEMWWLDTNPIISYVQLPIGFLPHCADMNLKRSLAGKLDGIADKILEQSYH